MFNLPAFLTYALVTAFTPGPNTLLSMTNAGKLGFRKALSFNFGIFAGLLVVMALGTAFSALLSTNETLKMILRILGAAYMLYLAWGTLRGGHGAQTQNARGGFVTGALLQFVNVKIILYCITSMSVYVLPHFSGFFPVAGFGVMLVTIAFISTVCWALFGAAFKRLFTVHERVVNAILAALLVYCAASLFL